jgi:hypothetical protein
VRVCALRVSVMVGREVKSCDARKVRPAPAWVMVHTLSLSPCASLSVCASAITDAVSIAGFRLADTGEVDADGDDGAFVVVWVGEVGAGDAELVGGGRSTSTGAGEGTGAGASAGWAAATSGA